MRPRDRQLIALLALARRLWFAEDRDDPETPGLREVLHDSLLERYGAAYEEVLEGAVEHAIAQARPWAVTFWPRMLAFAESGFPGWSETSRVRAFHKVRTFLPLDVATIRADERRASASPIGFAVATGPLDASGTTHTGENRSVLLMTIWPEVGRHRRSTMLSQRGGSRILQRRPA